MDLPMPLRVSLKPDRTLYTQVMDQVRAALAAGSLKPGERLPPVRRLARALGVTPNTVGRAYAALGREGLLAARRRAGTTVATPPGDPRLLARRARQLRDLLGRAALEALSLGAEPAEIGAAFALQLGRWRTAGAPEAPAPPARARRGEGPAVRCVGSHDLTLDLLAAALRRRRRPVSLDIQAVGSLPGLLALRQGEADLAGIHLLDPATGDYNGPIVSRLFPGERMALVTVAHREQGLLVAPGNPRGLRRLADLARPRIRLIRRTAGSGTHLLLEWGLRQESIPMARLRSLPREAATHLEVAAAVARGEADAGLGLRAAAEAFGLGFIPLFRERYDLVCPRAHVSRPPLSALPAALRDRAFRQQVRHLGGYDTRETGQIREVN
ncbi:MAG: substrate-binding domain-containing protein [Candidatus Methylomirabilales bacterium]